MSQHLSSSILYDSSAKKSCGDTAPGSMNFQAKLTMPLHLNSTLTTLSKFSSNSSI